MITVEELRKKQKKIKEDQEKWNKLSEASLRGECPLESKITLKEVEEQVLKDISKGHSIFKDKLKSSVINKLKNAGYKVSLAKQHIIYNYEQTKKEIKPATFWRDAVYIIKNKIRSYYEYYTIVQWDDSVIYEYEMNKGFANKIETEFKEL